MLTADVAEAERSASPLRAAYRVLVHLSELDRAAATVYRRPPSSATSAQPRSALSRLSPPPPVSELGGGFHDQLAAPSPRSTRSVRLRTQVQERGLGCVVLARTSADPISELVTHAAVLGADVVFLDERTQDLGDTTSDVSCGEVGCDVAIAIGAKPIIGPSQPVVAVGLGGRTHDTAALEIAARGQPGNRRGGGARRRRRRPRWVATARSSAQPLEPLGLSAEVVTATGDDAEPVAEHARRWHLLVVGLPASAAPLEARGAALRELDHPLVDAVAATTTVVLVRSRETFERDGLERMARSRAAITRPRRDQISA